MDMREKIFNAANSALSERLSRYNISQTGTVERDIAEHVVQAVLDAMREPTEEMIRNGVRDGNDIMQRIGARWLWEQLIEAAMIETAPLPGTEGR